MKEAGELIEWNDAKGFGFVRAAGGDRLFVHATAFERSLRRPEVGDRLLFQRGPGRDGRPSVTSAQIAGATARPRSTGPSAERIEGAQMARAWRIALAALLLLAPMILARFGRAPDWLLLAYLGMGLVTAIAYWLDKRAAEAGRWRVAESRLHMLDFAYGIIGGLLAQAALRHKTAKPAFAAITFGIVAAHFVGLAALGLGFFDLPRL